MTTLPDRLSDPLPAEPLEVAAEWLAEAWRLHAQPNPNAMTLATSTNDGRPSARMVLCKEIVVHPGYVLFYTNYHSRKGRELADNPRAAGVLHFDALQRQVRLEGLVEKATEGESDAYFASRSVLSRLSAWASAQSEPIESRARLQAQLEAASQRFGAARPAPGGEPFVPRPPHWGGYRLWAQVVELWVSGEGRMHDRACWSRELARGASGRIEPGAWSVTRLQP